MRRRRKVPLIDFIEPVPIGETVSILFQSDEHFDNIHTNQDLIREHLKQAVELGAPVCKLGDQLCLMQGKTDGRASKGDLRPEHKVPNYIDAVVNSYATFHKFAAPNIALIADGNHEIAVRERLETNVTERIGEQLRQAGSNLHVGGIAGWILVRIWVTSTTKTIVPIFYHHGHGGGGMGRGTGHANQRALYLPDAQVVMSGHIHEETVQTICRDRINTATGRKYLDRSVHCVCGTYKQEYRPEESGYHCKNGRPPKPVSGTWLDLTVVKEFDGELAKSAYQKGEGKRRLPRIFISANIRRAL